MIAADRARALAEVQAKTHGISSLREGRELRSGWYFSYDTRFMGSHGVIVNKESGAVFECGSAFPVERDLEMYDRGYQFDLYDLVVLEIHDLKRTRTAIGALGLMTDAEIWTRLERLPCIFAECTLYFHLEVLEEARRENWFTFEAHRFRRST